MIKKIIYINFVILVLTSVLSCSTTRLITADDPKAKALTDSIMYIKRIPQYFEATSKIHKGDSLCSAILDYGVDITPYLLNKLGDTTLTKYDPFAVGTYYTVGDVVGFIIDDVYSFNNKKSPFNVHNIVIYQILRRSDYTWWNHMEYGAAFGYYNNTLSKKDISNRKKFHRILRRKYMQSLGDDPKAIALTDGSMMYTDDLPEFQIFDFSKGDYMN